MHPDAQPEILDVLPRFYPIFGRGGRKIPIFAQTKHMTFTAIDFELATADYTSVCAVGIVKVENGEVVREFHGLVRPPGNKYMWQTTRVHGIKPRHTVAAPSFAELFPEIKPYLDHTKRETSCQY